jgi:hypothetical protein
VIPFRWRTNQASVAFVAALMPALSVGCDRHQVQSYRAPKEPAAPPHAVSAPAPEASQPTVRWQLPTGWQELPPSQMRVGSFTVTGANGQKAEISIIPLAGEAGGDLENVNRWRGQVGLARVSQADMAKLAEQVEVAGERGPLFDFAGVPLDGEKKLHLLAAILHRGATAWFFKMTGDDGLVTAEKPAFVQFLKTVSFVVGASNAPPAADGTGPDPASVMAPAPAPGQPKWDVPAAWHEAKPGPMQTARFSADDASGKKAEITVVTLPGDGGGTLANVNRWRSQLALGPVTETDLGKLRVELGLLGVQSVAVDLVATNTARRMIAAAVAVGNQTWFYKLMGDEAVVAREKEAFLQFVRTVKYVD